MSDEKVFKDYVVRQRGDDKSFSNHIDLEER
jgi:hypothetical protein